MVSIVRRQQGVVVVACLAAIVFLVKALVPSHAAAAGGGDDKILAKATHARGDEKPLNKTGGGEGDTKNVVPDTNLQVMMLRMSLSPEAMAAAGLSSGNVTSLVTGVKSYMANNPTAMSDADAAFATAKTNADRLERLVRSGLGSQEDVSSCATAQQTLATATTARQAILDGLFTTSIQNLSESQRTALTNIRANASWKLSPEYLVTNRSEASWVQLRDALSTKKIASNLHEDLDSPTQQYLTGIEADTGIAAAKTALATGLGTVTSAWNTGTAQQ